MCRQDRPNPVLALHHSIDDEDWLAVRDLAVTVVDVGLDRHVDLSELVLEREESDLFRRRRRLPRDDQPGDPHSSTARDCWELVALQGAELLEPVSAEMDEVVAGRKIGDAVLELVDVEVVELGQARRDGFELEFRLRFDAASQSVAVPSLLPAPEQLAAWPAEPVEGADHDEVANGVGADGATAESVEEIVEGGEGAGPGAFGDDRVASVLAEVAHVVEADAHGVGLLNRQGCQVFGIHIPWLQVCRWGEGTGQEGGPRR